MRLPATPLGHALLSLLRFAWAGAGRARALRVPPLAVLRASRARASTSPRAGCAAARSRRPSASRRRPSACARRRSSRCASCARADRRSRASARCSRVDGPLGVRARRRRPSGEPSRLDLRCVARGDARCSTSSTTGERLGEPLADRRRDRARSSGSRCRPAPPGEPGRVAVLDLLRARTRRFDAVFVLGLEEGSLPRRGRSSPFLDDDRRRELGRAARAARPGQPRPLPLLHRVHARDAAARARARGGDRRRLAARAEPVLGRGRGRLRPGGRRARDAAARALAS